MEEIIYLLISNIENTTECDSILASYHEQCKKEDKRTSLLLYCNSSLPNIVFRQLFHMNKDTVIRLGNEIRSSRAFRSSSYYQCSETELLEIICVPVLFINTCFSIKACGIFSGLPTTVVENYITLFNRVMNELNEAVIRFPALNSQSLLKVNSKRVFPGAVGVVCTVFVPKMNSMETPSRCFSAEHRRQGVKVLLVVGREEKIFYLHVWEDGSTNNSKIYNNSSLGYTLRFHKRSVLNRTVDGWVSRRRLLPHCRSLLPRASLPAGPLLGRRDRAEPESRFSLQLQLLAPQSSVRAGAGGPSLAVSQPEVPPRPAFHVGAQLHSVCGLLARASSALPAVRRRVEGR